MGSLNGPDNIFVFRTREYADNPLTIIGPGAGPTVTAMGLVGDLLQAVWQ
jgi:aspartokinase/homoserine dehydrogenase 1